MSIMEITFTCYFESYTAKSPVKIQSKSKNDMNPNIGNMFNNNNSNNNFSFESFSVLYHEQFKSLT